MEMYTVLATFFGHFDMQLYETDASSMEWADHGSACNKSNVKVIAKVAARIPVLA